MKAQKPIPAVLRMQLKDPGYDGDDLIGLSSALFQEGLILQEPRELRRARQDPSVLELTCTFVDHHAARQWRSFPKVRDHYLPLFKKGEPNLRFEDVVKELRSSGAI